MDETQKTVLKVIPIDSLKVIPDEFKSIPLYKVTEPGVLEISSGTKFNHGDVFVFDVTNMDQDFQARYAEYIVEFEPAASLDQNREKYKGQL